MLKKLFIVFLGLLVFYISGGEIVQAEEVSKNGGFSVSPLDINTGKIQNNYFDLTVTPNQKIDLKVRIYNSSSKELKVNTEANNGTTNDNGITSYLATKERDPSLKVAFNDFSKPATDIVTVPAHSTTDAVIHVNVPDTPFNGMILGGLRFTDEAAKERAKNSKAGVTNSIAYVIAVVLKESTQDVQPEMHLNKVITEQRNGRNYISANLQNSAPRLIKKMDVNAKIYKKGTNDIQYESSNGNVKMAPNSNFNYGTSLENQAFVAGDYTMKLKGTADGVPFSFEKDFTIKKSDSDKLNKNAVYLKNPPQDNTILYVVIGLLVTVLVIGMVAVLILRKKGREENEK